MKNLSKSILPIIIISLLIFILSTKFSLVSAQYNIPTLPQTPDKSDPQGLPNNIPTVPQVPDKPEVPTVPPVPTTPPGCCQVSPTTPPGNITDPTATPVPDNGSSNDEDGRGGITTTNEGGSVTSESSQVMGLSATSSAKTYEIIIMATGLIIASFGVKKYFIYKLS